MGQYRDQKALWAHVAVLQFPQKYDKQAYQNAQHYVDSFVQHNVGNLHEFFEMFVELESQTQNAQESTMRKVWVLNAIDTILRQPEYVSQVQQAPSADGHKSRAQVVHHQLMSLLGAANRAPGSGQHRILASSVFTNKFALLFVRFAARDFPAYWNTQFSELFGLLHQGNSDQQHILSVISKFDRIGLA